jgi:poly(hydroxyalkanoate) depolymerase family esterase
MSRDRGTKGKTMKNDFVAEILRATGTLRAGDPAGASDIIQAALAAGGLSRGAPLGGGSGRPRRPEGGGAIEGTPTASEADARVIYPEAFHGQRLRKPLGEVLRALKEGRNGLGLHGKLPGAKLPGGLPGKPSPSRAPDLPLPHGAEFRDLRHACAAGARRYRLYIPASADDAPQGLIVMLHGCMQNAEDFAAGTGMNTHAEKHRLLVAYPEQTNGDNAMSCWNWFRPGDQTRAAGEPAIIASLTRSVRDKFGVPHDRVFVAGLSAGGAMAAILGETWPELYAGVGVHSGLAHGSANDVPSAFAAMRGQPAFEPRRSGPRSGGPRTIIFHGDADATVHPSNAERIVESLGHDVTVCTEHPATGGRRAYARLVGVGDAAGAVECWIVDGAQHAWSGGDPRGSYTDPKGPDASAAMVKFFLEGSGGGAPA